MSARRAEIVAQDLPRNLARVADDTRAEVFVKSYRWLPLAAALLITLCEVLVFDSQSGRAPEEQANAGAVTDVGSGRETRGSAAGAASIYREAAQARSPRRVR
jgi:hypothetical protein